MLIKDLKGKNQTCLFESKEPGATCWSGRYVSEKGKFHRYLSV